MPSTYTPIEILHLNERTYNTLVRRGIDKVEILSTIDDEGLMSLRGMGKEGVQNIREKLAAYYSKIPHAPAQLHHQD